MDVGKLLELLFILIGVGIIFWGGWALLKNVQLAAPFRILITVVGALICLVVAWNVLIPLLASIGGGQLLHSPKH